MEHFRLRKYRGPDTWKKVREAYVAGEPGPSVARRFDVGLSNLRKKARREGWTRNRIAAELERAAAGAPPPGDAPAPPPGPPPEPPAAPEVRRRALDRAAALLAEGRAAEALAQLRAAEALARLAATEPEPELDEADAERARALLHRTIEARAYTIAEDMLRDAWRPRADWGGYVLAWRAVTLGPEVAARDRRTAEEEGWAARWWDADGQLWPQGVGKQLAGWPEGVMEEAEGEDGEGEV